MGSSSTSVSSSCTHTQSWACMYLYTYVLVHVCIYTALCWNGQLLNACLQLLHTYMIMNEHVCTRIHMYLYMYVFALYSSSLEWAAAQHLSPVPVHIHTIMSMYVLVYICTYKRMCSSCTALCWNGQLLNICLQFLYTFIELWACMYNTYTYVLVYVPAHIHDHEHVCNHIRIYVCIRVNTALCWNGSCSMPVSFSGLWRWIFLAILNNLVLHACIDMYIHQKCTCIDMHIHTLVLTVSLHGNFG
jgi:hypothetical protein